MPRTATGEALSGFGSNLLDFYKLKGQELREQEQARQESMLTPYKIQATQADIEQAKTGAARNRFELDKAQKTVKAEDAASIADSEAAIGIIQDNPDLASSQQGKNATIYLQKGMTKEAKELIGDYYTKKYKEEQSEKEFKRQRELKQIEITGKKEAASSTLPPALQKAKDKRAEDFIKIHENRRLKSDRLNAAEDALKKMPTGLAGKVITKYKSMMDPNDPVLAAWQKVKSVLTDATLMNTANTKGQISDKEMEEFKKAAANDELISPQRIGVILKILKDDLEEKESSAAKTYQYLYKEDPYKALLNIDTVMQNVGKTKSGNSFTVEQ